MPIEILASRKACEREQYGFTEVPTPVPMQATSAYISLATTPEQKISTYFFYVSQIFNSLSVDSSFRLGKEQTELTRREELQAKKASKNRYPHQPPLLHQMCKI